MSVMEVSFREAQIARGAIGRKLQRCRKFADSLPGRLGEQLGKRDPECAGDHLQVQDRDVPLSAFDGADERSVQIALLAEIVLGQVSGDAVLADPIADSAEEALV